MTNRGKVILVGAGPGAADLITLRGAAALRNADVVVYDALVVSELIELAPARAERINVGKRGHETPTRSQADITALLVERALAGRVVVRLKGGDPFVFGRGGEEASACATAGVPFEVVPGVSSVNGALAYAGIPLTDRRHSASFAVVTGHKDPTRVREQMRWDLLAQSVDTLVILMGMKNLDEIVGELLAGGRSPSTPAAIVMDGTLPSQQCLVAPLAEIAARARQAGLGAPAAVVIGDVVSLQESLAWFDRKPLQGVRVLVTRAEGQADEMLRSLRAAGALPLHVPMIRLLPVEDPSELDAALDRLESYEALLLTSANAAVFFAERARQRGIDLSALGCRVLCVGPRTAESAAAEGLAVDALPGSRFDAEGLVEEIAKAGPPSGQRFLLPRSDLGRDVLVEQLTARGATVDAVTVYRNAAPEISPADLRSKLQNSQLDVLCFTSPSTVRNFVELLDPPSLAAAKRCLIAGIGPVTGKALQEQGLPPDVVPGRSEGRALVDAVAAHFSERNDTARETR